MPSLTGRLGDLSKRLPAEKAKLANMSKEVKTGQRTPGGVEITKRNPNFSAEEIAAQRRLVNSMEEEILKLRESFPLPRSKD